LNRIQSVVFDTAFNSKKNFLVAAPTGAGKTNIALLTILREMKDFYTPGTDVINMNKFNMKIVYIAPLKALAAEIVDKFSKALAYSYVRVWELTGDMNLTK